MAGLTTSAGAVDIYSTIPESEPLLNSSALMSTYDSGISVTAVGPSDLDDYLSYGSYSVADYFASLNQYFWGTTVPKYSGYTFITNLTDLFDDFFNSAGFYLRDDGSSSNVNYSNNIADLVRMGFLGLSTNVKAVTSAIQSLDFNDYSSILSSIYSSVDGLESGLTSANTAIGGVTTAINNVRSAVDNVVSGLSTVNTSVGTANTSINNFNSAFRSQFIVNAGREFLGSNGSPTVNNDADVYFKDWVRVGFLGLRNYMESQFLLPINRYHLNTSGNRIITDSPWSLATNIEQGFVGVGALISGTSGVNSYSSTLNDNNNTTTTVYNSGLGPLLNTQLSNIGENLGHLAYVFASDEDIKLREDSQPLLDTTDSFYDDSDSNVKVSTNNVGSLKDVAGNFTNIIDADADIGDAFAVVSNSNTYRWFSADTAMNLDSLGVAPADFEESTYDRLHREFNEIYFPDRVGGGN